MSKSALIVTHHIFLTKEQRYDLQIPNKIVTVMGISSPMWVINGKWEQNISHEVFCNYKLMFVKQETDQTVSMTKKDYTITLTGSMPINLRDYNDEGAECLMMTHRNVLHWFDDPLSVLHCIEIEDINRCVKTICD